jgi:hypothetical protein
MYYPFETQVAPLASIRRERVLPAPGDTLVRLGDRVEPMQVVARARVPGEFRVISVARQLGVRANQIKECMRVKVGEEVRRGQVIAQKGLRPPVKSPISGILTASGGGRVLVETPPTPMELRAYIHGTVTNVLEGRAVVIETTGAVIQGSWGTGTESVGVLKRLVKTPEKILRAREIDASCHGTIIVGGAGLNEAVLERTQELQVRGIVTGGLSAELLEAAKKLPFPVVVTEGIGSIPMSAPVFQLLTTNDGREASISGRVKPRWGVVRPEVIIPLPAESLPSTQAQPGMPLAVGARVRIVRAPFLGQTGTVAAVIDHTRRLETGAKVRGVEVDLGRGKTVFVPLMNLEVLI